MAEMRVNVKEETMEAFEFIVKETGATPEQVLRVMFDNYREMVRRGAGVDDLYDLVEEESE